MKTWTKSPAIIAFGFCLTFGIQAGFSQSEAESSAEQDTQSPLNQEHDQQTFGSRPESRQSAQTSTTRSQTQSMEIYETSELEGLQVENMEGDSLGTVHSLAVDLRGQEASFIVVETDGILGIGADLKVVPVEAIQIARSEGMIGDEQVLRVDIDQTTWEQIPSHEPEEIARLCDEAETRTIYQHFNVERQEQPTEFGSPGRESLETETKQTESQDVETREKTPGSGPEFGVRSEAMQEDPSAAAQSGQSDPSQSQTEFGSPPDRELSGESTTETTTESDAQVEIEQESQTEVEQQSETVFGAPERERQTMTTTTTTQSHEQCELVLTTDLKGRAIQSAQQEEIGSVENVIFDLNTGRVQYVLLTPEGDIGGASADLFAVGPQTLSTITEEEIVLNVTRQELDQAEVLTQTAMSSTQTGPQVFRFQRESITFGSPDRESMTEEDPTRPGMADPEARDEPSTESSTDARDTTLEGVGRERGDSSTESARDPEFQGRDMSPERQRPLDPEGRGSRDRDRDRQDRQQTLPQDREFQGTDRDGRDRDRRDRRTSPRQDRGLQGTERDDTGLDSSPSDRQLPGSDRDADDQDSTSGSGQTPGSSPSRPL